MNVLSCCSIFIILVLDRLILLHQCVYFVAQRNQAQQTNGDACFPSSPQHHRAFIVSIPNNFVSTSQIVKVSWADVENKLILFTYFVCICLCTCLCAVNSFLVTLPHFLLFTISLVCVYVCDCLFVYVHGCVSPSFSKKKVRANQRA